MTESPSPFAKPTPGLRVKEYAPAYPRPSKEEAARFPDEAGRLLVEIGAVQAPILEAGTYHLDWIEGRHFVLAGATGSGLGGCLAAALLNALDRIASLLVISRDFKRSVEFETGVAMRERAQKVGRADRFRWSNEGLAAEGEVFERIVEWLKETGAKRVIYINTIASASSGLLPDHPPIYVKDIDGEGLFEWQLQPLSERAIETTKFYMGNLAVAFPEALGKAGVEVDVAAFSDWRGSLDGCSRVPENPEYGRQGPYSTSLYLPKSIVQRATSAAYRSGRTVIDVFFPVMKTRALSLIPGGTVLHHIYSTLLRRAGARHIDVPELALAMLDRTGRAAMGCDENPFPRLDMHEAELDLWFFEILRRLNNDEDNDFYFRKWLESD